MQDCNAWISKGLWNRPKGVKYPIKIIAKKVLYKTIQPQFADVSRAENEV